MLKTITDSSTVQKDMKYMDKANLKIQIVPSPFQEVSGLSKTLNQMSTVEVGISEKKQFNPKMLPPEQDPNIRLKLAREEE